MLRDEWDVISGVTLGEWWDSPQSDAQLEAWFEVLARYSADDVMAAFRKLLRETPRFAPRLGEVVAMLEPAPLSFDEVWTRILPVLRNGTVVDPDAAVARIAELANPLVAGWVASYGVRRLAMEPVLDPQFGGAVLKRLADSYGEMIREESGRQLALVRAQRAITSLEVKAQARAAIPETSGVGMPD